MKELASFIHKKGLKAGIYSDAGINTCGFYYDKDTIGLGSGLFGNEQKDLNQMFNSWNYDFIKIDWCGGEKLELDEQHSYTNKDLIAIDQDPLVYQARRINDLGNLEVWARPLISTTSGKVAIALLNRSDTKAEIKFSLDGVGIYYNKGYVMKDVWADKILTASTQCEHIFSIQPHGIVVLVISGVSKPHSFFS